MITVKNLQKNKLLQYNVLCLIRKFVIVFNSVTMVLNWNLNGWIIVRNIIRITEVS